MQQGEHLAAIAGGQRVFTQQVEDLDHGLARSVVIIAAVTAHQFQQKLQCTLVLLGVDQMNGQLEAGLAIVLVFRQAAAIDLAYVAAGRLDGFWETGLAPWDLAAGSLIIREAGGIISGLDGSENYMETGHVLTGSPKIYSAIARLCANEIRALTT